jgi:heme/copper-type cytochrome/quinol oxidase subunit 3
MATEDMSDHETVHHHIEESWWQPIMGLSMLFIGLGVFFIGKGVVENDMSRVYIGLGSLIVFFILFALALLNETSPKRFQSREKDFQARYSELLAKPKGFAKFSFIWIFLASETIFFTIVIASSVVVRLKSGGYTATGGWIPHEHLSVPLTAMNTFILIISSYTMVKGVQAIEHGNSKKAGQFLFLTFFFGLMFVSVQAYEYLNLWAEGFQPNKLSEFAEHGGNMLFPATFYLQTGFHGLHVLFGVFLMFFVALKAYRGGYTKENHDSVECIGYYWHYIDLVWIILFTFVYLF